jgi:predicted RNA-binding Zn ribbon-like protein
MVLLLALGRIGTSPVQLVTTIALCRVTCQDGDVKTFTFKCDSTALDFLGTLKSRRETEPIELLNGPEDAAAWLQQAGVAGEELELTRAEFESALALRDAVWQIVAARLDGESFPKTALAAVNAAAAAPDPVPQLSDAGRRVTADASQALSAVARDAIAVLSGSDVIKECSRDGCNQVYVDRSRGARREWCSMDPCGNRVKARDYRARKSASVAG